MSHDSGATPHHPNPTRFHRTSPHPTDAGSRGTGQGQYFRSTVVAVNSVGVCVDATAPTLREAAMSRKAGYRDHTFHQERNLLPPHCHRRRRDGAHLLRSRLPHTSYVGRSAKPARPIARPRRDSGWRGTLLKNETPSGSAVQGSSPWSLTTHPQDESEARGKPRGLACCRAGGRAPGEARRPRAPPALYHPLYHRAADCGGKIWTPGDALHAQSATLSTPRL
jgi:hypothetical protein